MRLTLELDSSSEPISGRMREESGDSRPFTGWLGLAVALGSVLGTRPDDRHAAQPPASTDRPSE